MRLNDLEAKAEILSHGLRISDKAIKQINETVLKKRRIYGNPDSYSYLGCQTPQEIVFKGLPIISNAIYKESSAWTIDYIKDDYYLTNRNHSDIPITFTKKPAFYDLQTRSGVPVKSVLTYLFGHVIGIFACTTCRYATQNIQCKFCSIRNNKDRPEDIIALPSSLDILEAIEAAINSGTNDFDCIFISGGNLEINNNDNFAYYANIAISIARLVQEAKKAVAITLNVYPPNDLKLIEMLRGSNINVVFSQEIFDERLFSSFCPGKAENLKRDFVRELLGKYVDILGVHHVFCFLIQGIESDRSLIEGARYFAELGTCPIIHILHVDPGTALHRAGFLSPSPDRILKIAEETSKIYSKYQYDSSQVYGGRSSFDKEASLHYI